MQNNVTALYSKIMEMNVHGIRLFYMHITLM